MHQFRILACVLSVLGLFSLALSAWAESPERFRVINIAPGDTLNVRAAPNAAAPISGTVPPGAAGIESVGECKAWCEIRYGSITGWVDRRFLQVDAKTAVTQSHATGQDAAIADCNSDERERRLRGCSVLIDRRELSADTLALAYSRRSDSYLDRGDFDRAIADLLQALALVPGDADHRARLAAAYFARGEQRRSKGDEPRAIADYTEALRYDTGSHAIVAARAAASARTNLPEKALADYRAALQLEPSSERYRLALAALLQERAMGLLARGEHDKAIETLNEAIRLNDAVALFYFTRGEAYVAKKNSTAARADFDKALSLEPGSLKTLVRRGQLHLAEKRIDLAIADFSQALTTKPDQPDVRLLKALALEEAGRLDEAAGEYRAIAKTRPDSKEAKAGLERIERTREAQKVLETQPNADRTEEAPQPPQNPVASAPEHRGSQLTASQRSLIGVMMKRAVSRCWNINSGLEGIDRIVIEVEVKLTRDGRLQQTPQVTNSVKGIYWPPFNEAAASAVRALTECQPYELPLKLYEGGWDHMIITFDPQQMF